MKTKSPKGMARIAIAAPDSACGGGAWSSSVSRHKYSSAPPSKKGTRIKRSLDDQFCTHRDCSEPTHFSVVGQTSRLESGHTVTNAPEKLVLTQFRKSQRDFKRAESWGTPIVNRCAVASKLTNGVAERALQRIAAAKLEKKEAQRKQQEEIINDVARLLANAKPSKARKSDSIFSLGNAFA